MEPSILLAVIGVFACVAVVTAMLTSSLLERQSAGNRRFKEVLRSVGTRSASASPAQTLIGKTNTPTPFVKQLSTFLPKSPKDMTRLQKRLATAGFHGSVPLSMYLIGEVVLAVGFLLVPLTLLGWRKGMIFGIMAAIVGYMIPS